MTNQESRPQGLHARRAARGFTLLELMVVVTVMAVLGAVATPSMQRLIAAQRVRSVATDLRLALVKARSEAIKRNRAVTLSPAGDGWSVGWQVLDPEAPSGPALQVHQQVPGVTVATAIGEVVYRGSGRTTLGLEGAFTISARGTDLARCVLIDGSGRPSVKEGSAC
jgi:type IV fimbrial biogenesis protein FimT